MRQILFESLFCAEDLPEAHPQIHPGYTAVCQQANKWVRPFVMYSFAFDITLIVSKHKLCLVRLYCFSEDNASLGLILITSTMAPFCFLTSTMASFDLSCEIPLADSV